MSQAPQSYANHVRLVPLYHFVLGGLLGVLFVRALIVLWRHPGAEAIYQLITAVALLLMGFYLRSFPVTVQDRVIRLEMRLRLAATLGQPAAGDKRAAASRRAHAKRQPRENPLDCLFPRNQRVTGMNPLESRLR